MDYGLFILPDSDNDDIQIVTDLSIVSNYPTLNDEATCTSNCLFKRSKDGITPISTLATLYNDFTDTVAMWDLDVADSANNPMAVSPFEQYACSTMMVARHDTS